MSQVKVQFYIYLKKKKENHLRSPFMFRIHILKHGVEALQLNEIPNNNNITQTKRYLIVTHFPYVVSRARKVQWARHLYLRYQVL